MALSKTTYGLWLSFTATAQGTAYVDFLDDANIVAVDWSGFMLMAAAGAAYYCCAELSLNGLLQQATNGANNLISTLEMTGYRLSEVGWVPSFANKSVQGIRFPVKSGTRLYLNGFIGGGTPTACQARAIIHVA